MRTALLCVVAVLPLSAARLAIHPEKIELAGREATQTYVVSYTGADGYERDVTAACAKDNVARAAMKEVRVSCKGLTAVATVIVKATAKAPGERFPSAAAMAFAIDRALGPVTDAELAP